LQDTLDQDDQLVQPRRNRAWRIHEFGGPEVLRREQVQMPSASPGQVVVWVKAVGINQLDWKFREGLVGGLPFRLPATLGVEFAGVITSVGNQVTSFQPGDRVMAHLYELGADADFVAVAAQDLARIPRTLSDIEAAALPTSASTAGQALRALGGPQPGMTVLIHGAAGAVGGFAVQLAKAAGATVAATASTANMRYVAGLGADLVIDYRSERFEEHVSDVDLALDFVGGETLDRTWLAVKTGGAVVSIAQVDVADRPPNGVRALFVKAMPDAKYLEHIADEVLAGRIRSKIAKVFAGDELPAAIEWSRISPPGKGIVAFSSPSTDMR
jgi:NADPH:quinone reductase-like Zn-dependent oxidoreductase